MNTLEKKNFVYALIDTVQSEILTSVDLGKIPENWDGIELRWFIADKFNDCVFVSNKKRKAEYKNTILVNKL